ncbi:hypothetical protein RhiirA5_409987 [Rhizophagus irregularis]|uniref:Uncharacterized protein n=2 Tax=Rhizophagus irregularis TaxID=588596 RepID=A0A2I1EJL1_9GLOM|nr:hypothetical protein RhiirA5_409987 [Rhizophagus irregularis]PKY22306.1 hypothetical protein RhiirB3_436206 [Rhizophagus irregularis]GBC34789.1 hypothetical protein RIR_jg36119.t1 [Rhizophagus irregularis DAOM 181602=DAOM 197198]
MEAKCSTANSKAKLSHSTSNAILYLMHALDYVASTIALLVSTPFHLIRAGSASAPDITYPNSCTPLYQCLSIGTFKSNLKHGNAQPPKWYKDLCHNEQFISAPPSSWNLLLALH